MKENVRTCFFLNTVHKQFKGSCPIGTHRKVPKAPRMLKLSMTSRDYDVKLNSDVTIFKVVASAL